MLKAIFKIGKRLGLKFLSNYHCDLNPKELIDSINDLEEYFEYEEIVDPKRVRFGKTKLKGHADVGGKKYN